MNIFNFSKVSAESKDLAEVLRYFKENETATAVQFEVGMYLKTKYNCAHFEDQRNPLAMLLYDCLKDRRVFVVDVALWILVSHKVKKARYEIDKGNRVMKDSYKVSKSLRDILSKESLSTWKHPKVSESYRCASDTRAFHEDNKKTDGYEGLYLALCLFLVGWGLRGLASRRNQRLDNRWLKNLIGISSFAREIPRWLNIDFLDDYKSTAAQMKLAAACAAFLSNSDFEKNLPGAIEYGLLRPICNLHLPLYGRIVEFQRRFPNRLVKDTALHKLPNVRAAINATCTLGEALYSAWEEGAEVEVLVGNVIFPGVHHYMGGLSIRKGHVSLLYACLMDDDVRGSDLWREFERNPWVAELIDRVEHKFLKAWVDTVKDRQFEVLKSKVAPDITPTLQDLRDVMATLPSAMKKAAMEEEEIPRYRRLQMPRTAPLPSPNINQQ